MTSDEAKQLPAWRSAAGIQGRRWRKGLATTAVGRRGPNGRGARMLTPGVEGLEDRSLLAAITWNTTAAPTGGDWNVAGNWNGGKVPGLNDTASIAQLTSPGTVYLNSGISDSVSSLTTDSSVNLKVITGSLSLGVASSSTLGGPVTVVAGASLSVGAGANVKLNGNQTITDNGTLSFAAGDVVSLSLSGNGSQIAVNGLLSATSTTFQNADCCGSTSIAVNSGGEIAATNSTFSLSSLSLDNSSVLKPTDLTGDTFNLPIYVP